MLGNRSVSAPAFLESRRAEDQMQGMGAARPRMLAAPGALTFGRRFVANRASRYREQGAR